ncbi:MAG: serine hydrolase domain-containing protein [Phycisphaerae bacterium]
MQAKRSVAVLFALLFAGAAVSGDPPRISECPELRELAARWTDAMPAMGVPGMAVVVVRGDEVICLDAWGIRDPRGDKPVTPDTMFYIASCTKPFTAAACAAFEADDKFKLDEPIRKHLPNFALLDEDLTAKLSLTDLLCHRYGISQPAIVFNDAYSGQITDDLYFRLLRTAMVANETEYSNIHFTLAGRVLEAVGGKSWKEVLADRIFSPVGMTRTTAYASRMYADENVAWPLLEGPRGEWSISRVVKTDRTMHAAGGLGTTARDLGRWLRVQLNEGRIDGKTVIPREELQRMLTKQSDAAPTGRIRRMVGFGLGWMLGTYRGRPYVQHDGGYIGATAHMSFLPEQRIGLAILVNAGPPAGGLLDVMAIDVYDHLLGLPPEDLLPKYTERAADFLAKHPPPTSAPARLDLSQAPRSYVGRFENRDFGVLEIVEQSGCLALRIGDLSADASGAERDQFSLCLLPDAEPLVGRFEIENGRAMRVMLRIENAERVFVRSE